MTKQKESSLFSKYSQTRNQLEHFEIKSMTVKKEASKETRALPSETKPYKEEKTLNGGNRILKMYKLFNSD